MFVSRKKYVHALEQWNHWQETAEKAIERNERLLVELKDMHVLSTRVNDLSTEIHEYNKRLIKELDRVKAKLNSTTRHIQLADGTIFAIEDALYRQKGDDVIQLHIDEYYEEVELLDTK